MSVVLRARPFKVTRCRHDAAAPLLLGAAVWLLMALIAPYFSIPLAAVFICVAAGMLIYAIAIYAISSQARQMVGYRLKVLREKRLKK